MQCTFSQHIYKWYGYYLCFRIKIQCILYLRWKKMLILCFLVFFLVYFCELFTYSYAKSIAGNSMFSISRYIRWSGRELDFTSFSHPQICSTVLHMRVYGKKCTSLLPLKMILSWSRVCLEAPWLWLLKYNNPDAVFPAVGILV